MANIESKQHYTEISIAKGILIILMVIGHSGAPSLPCNFLYQFHMPCFFLISGFLFKEKYLDKIGTFVGKRIKGLYIPFVKYSLVFLLLHNIFYHLHLYNNSYTLAEFITRTLKILTLTGSEQLLGGFWFLKELLYASVISILYFKLISIGIKLNKKVLFASCILFLILAYIASISPIKIPAIGSKTLLATSYFIAGHLFRVLNLREYNNICIALCGFSATFIASLFIKGNIDVQEVAMFPYFVVSIIGSISTIYLSKSIVGKCGANILDFIGKNTLSILAFHFISFKIVSFIIIQINDWPISRLSNFPVLDGYNAYLWILYTITGIVVPLIIKRLIDTAEESLMFIYNKYTHRTANDTPKA
ncbi:MAG: acyltransferase family protein [Bacteroidaceae bacterium]|nr:acyltransferase family protein [Bacteroidaceae bacterium]